MSVLGSEDLDILALYSIGVILARDKKKGARKSWCKKREDKRESYTNIDPKRDLRLENCEWLDQIRMDKQTYFELLNLITPIIKKNDTCMRASIAPHERLSATLQYLGKARSYEYLKHSTGISAQALGRIIPETCFALWLILHKEYMKFPDTESEWEEIANRYNDNLNFPNCLGVVHGKHVKIMPQSAMGFTFLNDMGFYSLPILVIISADYEFIMCEFADSSRISKTELLHKSTFYERLCNNKLSIPSAKSPTDNADALPYVFISGRGFDFRKDLLKPYTRREFTEECLEFNYRVKKIRSVVENTFGILASRFQIFDGCITLKVESIKHVIMGCFVLHNFLLRTRGEEYFSPENYRLDNEVAFEERNRGKNIFTEIKGTQFITTCGKEAKATRNKFMHFFKNTYDVVDKK